MLEETGVPEENPRVQTDNHLTILDTTDVDHSDQTWVAAVISECIYPGATWTTNFCFNTFDDMMVNLSTENRPKANKNIPCIPPLRKKNLAHRMMLSTNYVLVYLI